MVPQADGGANDTGGRSFEPRLSFAEFSALGP
jgi:hypothetical protein